MSFIVIPNDVTVFRVKVSNLSCDVTDVNPNFTKFKIVGNFDQFRTFTTPAVSNSPAQPHWDDFNVMFLYETAMPELLIAKNFMLALSCNDASQAEGDSDYFVGEATIDLLTLATGPVDVTLKVMNGECPAGRIYASIEMQEITEMRAELNNWKLWDIPSGPFDLADIMVTIFKRGNDTEYFVAETRLASDAAGRRYLTIQTPPHLYALTFPEMSETGGFLVELAKKKMIGKDILGTTTILFSNQALNKKDGDERYADFTFKKEINSGNDMVGELEGECVLSHLPVYSQMYAGRTVDGVVCFGQSYPSATKMPPFISTEHKADTGGSMI